MWCWLLPSPLVLLSLGVCFAGGEAGRGWVDTVPLCLIRAGQPCQLKEGIGSGCSFLVSPSPPSHACAERPCPVRSTASPSASAVVGITTWSLGFLLSEMNVVLHKQRVKIYVRNLTPKTAWM